MVQIPLITNWSVFPQNGDLEYFDDMNIWIGQGNTVIPSANASIAKMNEAIVEINNIAENAINAITFDNIAQLKLHSNIGRVDVLGYYSKGDGGGGTFYWDSTSTESDNSGTIIQATGITTGRWKRVFNGSINVKWFGAIGDAVTSNDAIGTWTGTNNAPFIQAAIDAVGGIYDLTSAYIFESIPKIIIPDGKFGITEDLFVNKNNVQIIGNGFFNTSIVCLKTNNIESVIRFQGTNGCELSDITIDGGLPFTPDLSENYGADIGVILDQVALFTSRNLNIMNTRYEGKRCIHLWESYFDNLRIQNVGFFGTALNPSSGIRFTLEGKQDNTFPGGESNNITYNKLSLGTVGSYVRMFEVPCYNIFFRDVTAEGRTWSVNYQSLQEDKWVLGGTSSNIVIDGAYTFAHYQPFERGVKLFYINNVGSGVKIKNYTIYSEKDNTYPEILTIITMYNDIKVDVDISVREMNDSIIKLYDTNNSLYRISGNISYFSNQNRARASLFSSFLAEQSFDGILDYIIPLGVYYIDYTVIGNLSMKWVDMTAYRTTNVTYTNTSKHPIQINFECQNSTATGTIRIEVDGISVAVAQATNTGYGVMLSGIIIPPNSTYLYGTVGTMSTLKMYELLQV